MASYDLPGNFRQVEAIINEIDKEHNKLEQVSQEIERKKKCLFACRLSNRIKNKNTEISFLDVTIYRNIFELTTETEQQVDIKNAEEYSFLCLEIFIPRYLQTIFIDNKFYLNISVTSCHEITNKTVLIVGKPIHEIVPIKLLSFNYNVTILFFGRISGKIITVKVPTVPINISHFLTTSTINRVSVRERLMILCKLYCPQSQNLLKEYSVKHQLSTSITQAQFLEIVLRNSYNFINVTTVMFDQKNTFHLGLDSKAHITYRSKSNILQLESDIFNLHRLKQYFINNLVLDENIGKKLNSFKMDDFETVMESYKALRSFSYRKGV